MTTTRRTLMGAAAALLALTATGALAQEVTLKLHQFLPAQSVVPSQILDVWADKVEADSGGRIKVDRYPSMQLGGTPPELIDQVTDGVADIVWTAVGYTPGRFPTTEVFELPFFVEDPQAAAYAFWKLYESDMAQTEFADVHMLGTWVHGPGLLHTADPVDTPADLQGMQIRGGSRLVNQMLEAVGATPVGMPVPAVSESLSKGVIDGATLPWEVTSSVRVAELVQNHTAFEGAGLYTLTFILAMNPDSYAALPDDLKAVVDANSGLDFSVLAAGVQLAADDPARQIAEDMGNSIVTIDAATVAADWMPLVAPIYDTWAAEMDEQGLDGQGLIDRARTLMAEYVPAQ
ncbi:TRAP-type C4-dicarboxylate transport system, substrate-binding protein [Loktanella fryxellensis]|uniref:TRAP-type C4-dicarboxylate transport system, substrate-binding protein n=1 Tax=Loktanella fryxellensis TaxID=245187 RepID=A0A1H8G8V1_9RHOB|nr:TRAP transporter substrate-binding protein [Loktanella fryxellensis]SEN40180.1 TRAP-type C4-dicarboxylate transport system, substrate-binding protein [Loktanella fryxellensis]